MGLDRTEKILSSVASVIAILGAVSALAIWGFGSETKQSPLVPSDQPLVTNTPPVAGTPNPQPNNPDSSTQSSSTWSGVWFRIQLLLIFGNSLAGAVWYACLDHTRHKDKSLLSLIGSINAFFALILCFYPSLGVLLYEAGHLIWDFLVQGGTVTAGYYFRVGLIALTWGSLAVAIVRTSSDV